MQVCHRSWGYICCAAHKRSTTDPDAFPLDGICSTAAPLAPARAAFGGVRPQLQRQAGGYPLACGSGVWVGVSRCAVTFVPQG